MHPQPTVDLQEQRDRMEPFWLRNPSTGTMIDVPAKTVVKIQDDEGLG